MTGIRHQKVLYTLITGISLAFTSIGCGQQDSSSTAVALGHRPQPPATVEITPQPESTDQPISSEIGIKVNYGNVSEVTLVSANNSQIMGHMRDDGTSWVPAEPLEYSQSYTATVTATGADGKTATATTSFTTMKRPTKERIYTGLYLFDEKTYGVGMPVVVEFETDIPVELRSQIQRRLFIKSDPPQLGAWRWFGMRTIIFRPQNFWKPGTTLTVRSALGGLPIGNRFGDVDRSASSTIGRDLRIDIDNSNKRMTVLQEGQIIRTIPVSLGKPSTPTSSGAMVIMSKETSTVFDTTATDGPDGYRVEVSYAQRLTWGGEYIHAAPWSVGDQGYRNVSHGCTNISMGNASWLFEQTLIGDPVTIRGTERTLTPGNGWTVWNMSWEEFTANQ